MTKPNKQRLTEQRKKFSQNVKTLSEHSTAISVLRHKLDAPVAVQALGRDSSSTNKAACQQIADQIAADQNNEILLLTAIAIAQAELMLRQQDLQTNLSHQLSLYGQANAMGCNSNTGP